MYRFICGNSRVRRFIVDVVEIITQLGFPAGIALFALLIVYKHEEFLQTTLKDMIGENTKALEELRSAIDKIGRRKEDEE